MRTVKQQFRSGLIPESDAFARLQAEYVDRYSPVTAEERSLVDTLIRDEWLLRRLRVARVETAEICDSSSAPAKLLENRIQRVEASYREADRELAERKKALERAMEAFLKAWPETSARWVM